MKDEKKVTEKLNEVNGVRELSDEELAPVVGGRSETDLTLGIKSFGGNLCPYCHYCFIVETPQQIDDHINNCQAKPFEELEDPFKGSFGDVEL